MVEEHAGCAEQQNRKTSNMGSKASVNGTREACPRPSCWCISHQEITSARTGLPRGLTHGSSPPCRPSLDGDQRRDKRGHAVALLGDAAHREAASRRQNRTAPVRMAPRAATPAGASAPLLPQPAGAASAVPSPTRTGAPREIRWPAAQAGRGRRLAHRSRAPPRTIGGLLSPFASEEQSSEGIKGGAGQNRAARRREAPGATTRVDRSTAMKAAHRRDRARSVVRGFPRTGGHLRSRFHYLATQNQFRPGPQGKRLAQTIAVFDPQRTTAPGRWSRYPAADFLLCLLRSIDATTRGFSGRPARAWKPGILLPPDPAPPPLRAMDFRAVGANFWPSAGAGKVSLVQRGHSSAGQT